MRAHNFKSKIYLEVNMGRYFRIICLKRSRFADSEVSEYTSDWFNQCDIVYWAPDRAGYTSIPEDAGLYSLVQLGACNGSWLDWMAVPIYVEEEE
jgi:hypothetical protein